MEASKPKWVDSILNIIGVNSLRLEVFQILPLIFKAYLLNLCCKGKTKCVIRISWSLSALPKTTCLVSDDLRYDPLGISQLHLISSFYVIYESLAIFSIIFYILRDQNKKLSFSQLWIFKKFLFYIIRVFLLHIFFNFKINLNVTLFKTLCKLTVNWITTKKTIKVHVYKHDYMYFNIDFHC